MALKLKPVSWSAVILAFAVVLCLAVVLGSVVHGDNITSSDPLISLSYLNGIFKTDLMAEVGDTIDGEVEKLNGDLTKKISGVRDAIGHVSSPAATHSTVTVTGGSAQAVSSGSEFLLLSGSATADEAGLLDVTTGLTVAKGEALLENHLYIASARVSVRAETTTKLLVRK